MEQLIPFVEGAVTVGSVAVAMALQRSNLRLRTENQRLLEESRTDPLTALLNRRGFQQDIERRLAAGEQLGFLVADVDNFKKLNDSLGHDVGDIALQMVSNHLNHTLRDSDMVAGRRGGDEFAVVANLEARGSELTTEERLSAMGSRVLTGFLALQGVRFYNHRVNPQNPLGLKIYYSEFESELDLEANLKNADPKSVPASRWAQVNWDYVSEASQDEDVSQTFLQTLLAHPKVQAA